MTLVELQAAASERPLDKDELSWLGDYWVETQERRLALDRQSKKLKAVEDATNYLLLDQLMKQKLQVSSPTFTFKFEGPSYVPHVDDWAKFWTHIATSNDFSLLEKRPGKAAIQEQWDAGVSIPGVEKYPVFKLVRSQIKEA